MVDLDAVQALATAASDRPWQDNTVIALRWRTESGTSTWPMDTRDAAYIRAMDPQTTLALLAELRAAREFAERFDKWRLRGEQSYQSVLDARDAWLAAYDKVTGEGPR